MESKKFSLNRSDWKQIGTSALIWSWPMFAIYFGQLTSVIQVRGGINLNDFVPTAFTLGVATKWLIDRLQNIYQKFTGGN